MIGFAAETGNVVAEAVKKIEEQGLRLDRRQRRFAEGGVFGGDRNTVHLISAFDGAELAGDDARKRWPTAWCRLRRNGSQNGPERRNR